MRKQVVGWCDADPSRDVPETWLDLDSLVRVEITSEDQYFPIENALTKASAAATGWRASTLGPQTISLHFDAPQSIRRIVLRFSEKEHERAQEFLLSYGTRNNQKREIVRQQWAFSPGGATEEFENYLVDLRDVVSIELMIDADRGQNRFVATLAELRIA